MTRVTKHSVTTVHGTAEEIIADLLERLNAADPARVFKADIQTVPVTNALPEGYHVFPLEVPGAKVSIVAPRDLSHGALMAMANAWSFCGEHILTLPDGSLLTWSR